MKDSVLFVRLDTQTRQFIEREAAARRESMSLVVRDAIRNMEREQARRKREEGYQNAHRSNS